MPAVINAPGVKPNLFIVGAPKCGTTAWVSYLGSHPDIFFSEMKEPNYFLADFPKMRFAVRFFDRLLVALLREIAEALS